MAAEKKSAGTSVWDAWAETLKAAASPMSAYASLLSGWRQPADGPAAGSASEPNPESQTATPADFVEAFWSGPRAMLRMTELAAETLRSTAASDAAPEAESALKRALHEFSDKLTKSPLLNGLELWTAAAAQQYTLAEPWAELMQRWIGIAGTMGGPSGAGDPLGDALERSFGVLADFPGVNAELPKLVREATANAVALATARETYRLIMAATWQRAFEEITREMLRRAADGKPVNSAGTLLSLSTSVADRIFVETFNSARYIDAQQHLSTALANQRRTEAQVVDLFARLGHFPTRRDHDEALREINALRREVHALKRLVRTLPANLLAASAATPASTNNGTPAGRAPQAKAAAAQRRPPAKAPRAGAKKTKNSDRGT
jgi:hypothetical protein